jgi:ribonuclease M5
VKPEIREAIVVEGRYDKNTLSQIVDALIIETDGFGIFNNKEKLQLIRQLAESRGVIILTDSDSAGFFIRTHIQGSTNSGQFKHAYIPDIPGRERRKTIPGKSGNLGVEGMTPEVILKSLRDAGASFINDAENLPREKLGDITKGDLYSWGLFGGHGSAQIRRELLRRLELPKLLSTKALINVLNTLYTRDEVMDLLEGLHADFILNTGGDHEGTQ